MALTRAGLLNEQAARIDRNGSSSANPQVRKQVQDTARQVQQQADKARRGGS